MKNNKSSKIKVLLVLSLSVYVMTILLLLISSFILSKFNCPEKYSLFFILGTFIIMGIVFGKIINNIDGKISILIITTFGIAFLLYITALIFKVRFTSAVYFFAAILIFFIVAFISAAKSKTKLTKNR